MTDLGSLYPSYYIEMSNVECRMVESLGASLFELRPHTSLSRFKIDKIHYSMFNVGRSMFDVQFFFSIDVIKSTRFLRRN